jgi:hypothetical protein
VSSALLSREEAARLCGVCVDTFDKHVRPKLLTKRVGRRVLVEEGSLRQWLGARTAQNAPDAAPVEAVITRRGFASSPLARDIAARLEARRRTVCRQP